MPLKYFSLAPQCVSLSLAVNNKIKIPPGAEELVGRAVEHLFEKEDGEKNEWRGMVLSRAPIMTHWYYITYEKDPVLYMYQLWDDYKDGDLRVLPESGKYASSLEVYDTTLSINWHHHLLIFNYGQRTNTCCQQTGSQARSRRALWANRWSTSQITA